MNKYVTLPPPTADVPSLFQYDQNCILFNALSGGNVFEGLMDAVRYCSLGQLSQALFEVGGKYRRNM